MTGISVTISRFDADRLQRQFDFATARALTATAKAAQIVVTGSLPARFDRPTPFTPRGIAIEPARRNRLVSAVYVRPIQAGYLDIQETGGARVGRKGDPVQVPVGVRTNAYGNIPRAFWRRLQAQKPYIGSRTFSVKTRRRVSSYGGGLFIVRAGDARTKHLPAGIYERGKVGNRRRGGVGTVGALYDADGNATGGKKGLSSLKLLVRFHKSAEYEPRFGFRPGVRTVAQKRFREEFAKSLADALRTARR